MSKYETIFHRSSDDSESSQSWRDGLDLHKVVAESIEMMNEGEYAYIINVESDEVVANITEEHEVFFEWKEEQGFTSYYINDADDVVFYSNREGDGSAYVLRSTLDNSDGCDYEYEAVLHFENSPTVAQITDKANAVLSRLLAPADEKLYTIAEVAQILDVTAQSVYNWVKSGELKSSKLGSITVVSARDMQSFERPKMGRPRKGFELRVRTPDCYEYREIVTLKTLELAKAELEYNLEMDEENGWEGNEYVIYDIEKDEIL